jgi:hypothetical protein
VNYGGSDRSNENREPREKAEQKKKEEKRGSKNEFEAKGGFRIEARSGRGEARSRQAKEAQAQSPEGQGAASPAQQAEPRALAIEICGGKAIAAEAEEQSHGLSREYAEAEGLDTRMEGPQKESQA